MPGKIKGWLLRKLWQDPNYELNQVSCPEITIDSVDQTLYGRLLAQATAAGAEFDGGKATIEGFEMDWNYDSVAGVLHVTCTKKPFYISCGIVEAQIRKMVDEARGSENI